jgi:hypothetical protein
MATSQRLSFSQFLDFLVWSLYAYESAFGAGQFRDLREFASNLRAPVDQQWVLDAGKVLESRGLARCIFSLGGHVEAMLTGEGRLLAEELLNREGSFVAELVEHPAEYVHWTEPQPASEEAESLEQERAPVFVALNELETAVTRSAISDGDKADLLADVETLRTQLRKRDPHLPVVADLLESISAQGFGAHTSRLAALIFV